MQADDMNAQREALALTRQKDWQACLSACARLANADDSRLASVARLNMLICQYRLGQHVPVAITDIVPLLDELPAAARPTCLCVKLLASHEVGAVELEKVVLRILAGWNLRSMELPSAPIFVLLGQDGEECEIVEDTDASIVTEIIDGFLEDTRPGSEDHGKLESLAQRYRERAIEMESVPQGGQ